MQFAGLKDLLKKNKDAKQAAATAAAPQATSTSGSLDTTTATATTTTTATSSSRDPYAAAVQRALANKANADATDHPPADSRKRRRSEEAVAVDGDDDDEGAKAVPSVPAAVAAPEKPPLLTRPEFDAQRRALTDALAATMETTAAEMKRQQQQQAAATATTTPTTTDSIPLMCIPNVMRELLFSRYVFQDPGTAGRGLAEEREHAAVLAALTNISGGSSTTTVAASVAESHMQVSSPTTTTTAATADTADLSALVRAMWFLTAASWQAALLGNTSTMTGRTTTAAADTHQSPELAAEFGPIAGWCYLAYLLAEQALPDVLRFSCGREVATCLEAWRAARRPVNGALQLLAFLLYDYDTATAAAAAAAAAEALARASEEVTPTATTPGGSSPDSSSSDGFIVPSAIRAGLSDMLVRCLQQRRDFPSARQAYADLTLGSANWKLGLFSGGEVHMRRSVEKLERNRIAHVLNNETAMRLLHSARELVVFAEQQWRSWPLPATGGGGGGQPSIREQFFPSSA